MSTIDSTADIGLAPPATVEAEAPTPDNRASYTRVAILFHWIIALFVLGQIGLGWSLGGLANGPARGAMIQLHKSIGITILLLSLARLAWRIAHKPPPRQELPRWQRRAADAVHWGFYVIMIAMPLTGWIMVSASTIASPIVLFGVVPWPALPGLADLEPSAKAAWHAFGRNGHAVLAFGAIALLLLHLGAVAKHQLLDRDRVFARMAPGARPGWREKRLWLALACALIVALVGRNYVSIARPGKSGPLQAQASQVPSAPAEGKHGAR